MRSVPTALAWEALTRLRRENLFLTIAFFFILAGPFALLRALLSEHGLDPSDPSTSLTHRCLIVMEMCVIGIMTIGMHGSHSRLSPFPVRTSTLVGYHMLFAAITTSLLSIFTIELTNRIFRIDWPVYGPVLFAVTVVAAFQGSLLFAEKTAWLPSTVIFFGLLFGRWFFLRMSHVNEIWPDPTLMDLLAAIVMLIISYLLGVSGVTRSRCGETLKPLGIVALLEKIADFRFEKESKFRSSHEAQSWFDWQMMGWNLPLAVLTAQLACLVTSLISWLVGHLTPQDFFSGYVASGIFLCLGGVGCGLVGGTSDTYQRNFQLSKRDLRMSQFLASKPVSNRELANSLLKVLAKSVLIGWELWVVGFLLTILLHPWNGTPQFHLWLFSWYAPTIFLGCWSLTATTTALFAAGHPSRLLQLALVIVFLLIASSLTLNLVDPETTELIRNSVLTVSGIAVLTATCFAFVIAYRKDFVSPTTAIACAAFWIFLATLIWIVFSYVLAIKTSVCLLCVGLASLVVFPFAATPLAIGWNRTR